jgi:hypothetical protein
MVGDGAQPGPLLGNEGGPSGVGEPMIALVATIDQRTYQIPRAHGASRFQPRESRSWRVALALSGGWPLSVPPSHRDSLYGIHGHTRADAVAALTRWASGCAEALRRGIAEAETELARIERRIAKTEARIAAGTEDEDDRGDLNYLRGLIGEDCAAGGGVLGQRAAYRITLSAIESAQFANI